MADESLDINFDETKTTGEEIIQNVKELKNCMEEVKVIDEKIKQIYEAKEMTAYVAEIENQMETIGSILGTIEDTGKLVVRASEAYKEASDQNASRIG